MGCIVTTKLPLKCKRQLGKKLQIILLFLLGREGVGAGSFCRLDITHLLSRPQRSTEVPSSHLLQQPQSCSDARSPHPAAREGRRASVRLGGLEACRSEREGLLSASRGTRLRAGWRLLFFGGEDFQRSLWDLGTHRLPWE